MQIVVSSIVGGGFTEITVEHEKEKVSFSCKVFSKLRLADPTRVFLEFNEWIKTTPKESQDEIFKHYKNIRELYDTDLGSSYISTGLTHEVKGIYDHVDLNKARRWLSTIGNIHVPADVADRMDENSRYNKPEQTYLRHDYVNLATVCMGLRLMLPIWGEFIDLTTENELFKETEALGLISRANIIHWPLGEYDYNGEEITGVFDKVSDYVKFCADDKTVDLGSLWKGISSIEIPIHITAKVMVRRLPIVSLNDHSSHSIVANIFQYTKSNLTPQERTSADKVKDKHPGAIREDDDKNSFMEGYKTKQRISAGDIVTFNIDAMDYELLATRVDESIDRVKLEKCIEKIAVNENFEINPHQILLAQWIMAKAFPARAFYHIDKMPLHYLLATAQALCWHWDFKDIALFLQVEALYSSEFGGINQLNQTQNGNRIAGRFKQLLDESYPHMKVGRLSNNGTRQASENMASNAINDVSQSLRSSNWVYQGPEELYLETEQNSPNRVLIIPINVKHMLAELTIKLADINQ